MRKDSAIIIIVISAAALLLGCGPKGRETERAMQSVAVETVQRALVTRTVTLFGAVQGERQAAAVSKLAGRVTSIEKPEGSWVKAGDPIIWVVNDVPGMDYKPGPVAAPISGRVGRVYVDIGQMVAPGVPAAVVADYSSRVRVVAGISDQDLRFARKNAFAEVKLSAFPDTTFTGQVTKVAPMLDQVSRNAAVEVTVDNRTGKLVPGMAASVRLVLEEKTDVVALPLAALFTNGLSRVAALDGDIARFRKVTIGLVGDRLVEVVAGVAPGEKVITTGKERVEDGSRVRPVEVNRP